MKRYGTIHFVLIFSLLLSLFQPIIALKNDFGDHSRAQQTSAFELFKQLIPAPLSISLKDLKTLWSIGYKKATGRSVSARDSNEFNRIISEYKLKKWAIISTIAVIVGGVSTYRYVHGQGEKKSKKPAISNPKPKPNNHGNQSPTSSKSTTSEQPAISKPKPKPNNHGNQLPTSSKPTASEQPAISKPKPKPNNHGNQLPTSSKPTTSEQEEQCNAQPNFKYPQFYSSAGILPVRKENGLTYVLIPYEFRLDEGSERLHLLVGGVESKDQENASQTAAREFREEVGQNPDGELTIQKICDVINQTDTKPLYLSGTVGLGKCVLYVVKAPESFYGLPDTYDKSKQGAEAEELLWVKWDALKTAVLNFKPGIIVKVKNTDNNILPRNSSLKEEYPVSGYLRKIVNYKHVQTAVESFKRR